MAIRSNRPSPPQKCFAIHYVEKFNELEVAHSSAAQLQQIGSGLRRFGFIEA
jgi:hypothetical protein